MRERLRTGWLLAVGAILGAQSAWVQSAWVQSAWAQPARFETCTQVHAYCMQLCGNGVPTPPPEWTCEVNRCFGLQECLQTGMYHMGGQFGHHAPRRTEWGPFEKK